MKSITVELTIPTTSFEQAMKRFSTLYSQEGAKHFSNIKQYSKYESTVDRGFLKVTNEYKTFFGSVRQNIRVRGRKMFFEGNGPFNIRFQGVWSMCSLNHLHLQQTVICPRLVQGKIKHAIEKTVNDLQSI
jgi:hypothetical protein